MQAGFLVEVLPRESLVVDESSETGRIFVRDIVAERV